MKQGSQTSSSDVVEKKTFKERSEEYFVQYENTTTLVVIEYGEKKFGGYDSACGFIDDHVYMDYKENMNLNISTR